MKNVSLWATPVNISALITFNCLHLYARVFRGFRLSSNIISAPILRLRNTYPSTRGQRQGRRLYSLKTPDDGPMRLKVLEVNQ